MYDAAAGAYAQRCFNELERKPFDRQMLRWLGERVEAAGPLLDLGSGPGRVAAYLSARGHDVHGIDISPSMVEKARTLLPGVEFSVGDMERLTGVSSETFVGVAAFYSFIHFGNAALVRALGECYRILKPNGWLLAAVHVGRGVLDADDSSTRGMPCDLCSSRLRSCERLWKAQASK